MPFSKCISNHAYNPAFQYAQKYCLGFVHISRRVPIGFDTDHIQSVILTSAITPLFGIFHLLVSFLPANLELQISVKPIRPGRIEPKPTA